MTPTKRLSAKKEPTNIQNTKKSEMIAASCRSGADPACNRACRRLQPYAPEAATVCSGVGGWGWVCGWGGVGGRVHLRRVHA
eukprot:scaffold8096_cov44-Phaeocystis_antarctica.AAC.1